MRKFIFIIGLSLVVLSCGGDDDSSGPTPTPTTSPKVNKAPSAPTQSAPTNNLLCIDNNVAFQWTASTDPDGDAISYEMQIATDNQFSQNVQNKNATDTSISIALDKGVAYYWRVRAIDSKVATSSYSSIFSFYTEGIGESNHLPFSPAIVKPVLNSSLQESSIILEWTASDVDTSDTLTFDVYFDTVNPPTTKVSENQSETTLTQVLEPTKNYYWKVVVKDDKGGETIGQIWSFKTD